jgi:UDP-glucuronate 4-epimerase
MARYLLTGAAGFIGSHVAEDLLSNGHQVVGLDNLNDAYDLRLKKWRLARLEARKDFVFHEVDIVERESLDAACGDGDFSAVINLAARAGVRQSVRTPGLYYQTNVIGTLNLLDLCRRSGIQKFVQASTSSLYGAHNPRPFKENADISRPLSPYAASKGAAELLCYSYHHLYGLDITILRYFTVYGPAGRPDMSVFRFIQWIAENKPLILYGDGYQERDFTYVGDIAHGTLSALRPLGFEIVNLGGDHPVSIIEVIRRIENLLGKQAAIDQHGQAPADVRATWADINKARDLLEWEPQVSLQAGLETTVNWYLTEREWASRVDTTD